MIWIASSLLFVLTSCEDSEGKAKPIESKATNQTEVADTQTTTVSPKYKNGINEHNKGDKTGNIRLHGSIPSRDDSYMFLYQTEARTVTLIDSTIIENGVYNFKKSRC